VEALGVALPIFSEVPNHTERTRVQTSDRVRHCQPSIVLMKYHGELVLYTASAVRAVLEVLQSR